MTVTVIMRTQTCDDHVRYVVERDDRIVWHTTVRFGQDHRHRAGGPAFVEAAREQAAQALAAREAL